MAWCQTGDPPLSEPVLYQCVDAYMRHQGTMRETCKHALFVRYPVRYSNTLMQRQNGAHFADDTIKSIFSCENCRILIPISLKFVPNGPINNNPALIHNGLAPNKPHPKLI